MKKNSFFKFFWGGGGVGGVFLDQGHKFENRFVMLSLVGKNKGYLQ
jgi:hypothetical protein